MWFVYILECEDGLLYTGITNNLERRFKEHSQGKGDIIPIVQNRRKCSFGRDMRKELRRKNVKYRLRNGAERKSSLLSEKISAC